MAIFTTIADRRFLHALPEKASGCEQLSNRGGGHRSEFLGEEQSCCLINPNNGQEKTTWKVARRPTDSAPHRMRLPAGDALVVSAGQRSTSPFLFIPVGSDQYPKVLVAFGKATTEPETLVPYLWQRFRDKVASGGSVAIDFAAGAEGRHLHLLLDAGFSKVYAGDCDPASCAALRCAFSDSKVTVIQDDILAMDPPEAVDAGLLIHVGYPSHVDAKAWPRYIRHCMETLAPGGQLFVVLVESTLLDLLRPWSTSERREWI